MPKLNAFLTSILPAEAFPNNDLAAILGASALKDIDIPDEVATKFNSHYLTRDRALNDDGISKELKNRHFGHWADKTEGEFKEILDDLPQDVKEKYLAIPKDKPNGIWERIGTLKEGVKALKTAGSGEDVKTATAKFRATESELREKLTSAEKEKNTLMENFAKEREGIEINYALRSKLTGLIPKLDQNLVKQPEQKDFLIESTIAGLPKKGLRVEFDKENKNVLHLRKLDGTDLYEGNNTKVTLDSYLEKAFEPYTVKNNGGTPPPKPPIQSNPQTQNNGGMTLRDKVWAGTTV